MIMCVCSCIYIHIKIIFSMVRNMKGFVPKYGEIFTLGRDMLL